MEQKSKLSIGSLDQFRFNSKNAAITSNNSSSADTPATSGSKRVASEYDESSFGNGPGVVNISPVKAMRTAAKLASRRKPNLSMKSSLLSGSSAEPVQVAFAPVMGGPPDDPLPRLLVLGSAPSDASLAAHQYYGFKHNHFWKIMGSIAEFDSELPYESRLAALKQRGVALWDVIHCFRRKGSLDSAIDTPIVNDFTGFFHAGGLGSSIECVALNGAAAAKLFRQHVQARGLVPERVRVVQLPSSSPAHAMKDAVVVKTARWRELLEQHLVNASSTSTDMVNAQ